MKEHKIQETLEEDIVFDERQEKETTAGVAVRYVYTNKKTKKRYTLEGLQNKYELGFADSRLWKIIERDYSSSLRPQSEKFPCWNDPKI